MSVSQNGDRDQVLQLVLSHFGCGTIRKDPGDKTYKWERRSVQTLREDVLPHFRVFPMLSGKQADYELLAQICSEMASGNHHSIDGLIRIVQRARIMNPSGRRRYDPDKIIHDLETR